MLLWPRDGDLKVTVGDVHQYACDILQLSQSASPEGKERTLVDHLIHCCANQAKTDKELKRAILILRKTAHRWSDAPLLISAVNACKADMRIDIMGVEGFVWAYWAFGFGVTKEL